MMYLHFRLCDISNHLIKLEKKKETFHMTETLFRFYIK